MMMFAAFVVFAISLVPANVGAQSIGIDSSCVLQDTPLDVSFSRALLIDDWIALIPLSFVNDSLQFHESDIQEWSWKCGGYKCATDTGRTILPNRAPHGQYVVALMHKLDAEPFQGFAISRPFTIASDCGATSNVQSTAPVTLGVSQRTFRVGEPISVLFANHNDALSDDFISIYRSNALSRPRGHGLVWKHICNRQDGPCIPPPTSGAVLFDAETTTWSTSGWPLAAGSYKAFLVRNAMSNGIWVVVGMTHTFDITNEPPPEEAAATLTSTSPSRLPLPPPTNSPSSKPTNIPQTNSPVSSSPTNEPSVVPTPAPTQAPTNIPSISPTKSPSLRPTNSPSSAPSGAPFPSPTGAPAPPPTFPPTTAAPVSSLTAQPSRDPTTSPVTASTGNSAPEPRGPNAIAMEHIRQARASIEGLIQLDADLAPKFLRLIFHDCIGGCDGCVDLTNIENRGLDKPIDALEPIFDQHKEVLSRADIWALAATIGTDVTQPVNERIEYPFEWWGRVDCTGNDECRDINNNLVPCTPKLGPHHDHPTIHLNTADLYHFFLTEFDFDVRESIVAMGAHTIGTLSMENSGINGPHGWDTTNTIFDTVYYTELVGGTGPLDPLKILVDDAPRWTREIEPSTGELFIDRRMWTGFPEPDMRIIMLNTDIALFRNLTDSNYVDTRGESKCAFEDETAVAANIPRCPAMEDAVRIGAELRHDTNGFLVRVGTL